MQLRDQQTEETPPFSANIEVSSLKGGLLVTGDTCNSVITSMEEGFLEPARHYFCQLSHGLQ